jgi:putative NADH-flavin reductase
MAKVLVFGANGYAGSAIVQELADRGHQVLGVSRNLDPKSSVAGSIELVAGSFFDQEFLDAQVPQVNAVIISMRSATDEDGQPALIDWVPIISQLCAQHGVRLGFVGGAGSMQVTEGGPRLVDTPEFPDAFKHEALSHAAILDALRDDTTGVDWFYVSPAGGFGGYAPGPRLGHYRTSENVMLKDAQGKSYISAPDLAVAFADEIETPKHSRQRFQVAY